MLHITDPREHPVFWTSARALVVYDGEPLITSSIETARDIVARLRTVGADGVIEPIPTNLICPLYRVSRTL